MKKQENLIIVAYRIAILTVVIHNAAAVQMTANRCHIVLKKNHIVLQANIEGSCLGIWHEALKVNLMIHLK